MSVDDLRTELAKLASLVGTARRLLAAGKIVDLSALPAKMRGLCEGVEMLDVEEGRRLLPEIEALDADLGRLGGELAARQAGAEA